MTLQIGTDELAQRLYEAWRQKVDRIDPLTVDEVWEAVDGQSVLMSRIRPRARWEHLDSVQYGVWRAVAEEAGRVLADAEGRVA